MGLIRRHIYLFLVLLFVIPVIFPLFNSGFYPMHDDEQVGRLYDLSQALSQGHIPPRLSPNLGFGYGYPFFNFYPPLVYYISVLFVFLGFGYILSIKIMIALGFFLAALAMYEFSKEFFGKLGGFTSAILYTYAPYHSVDVYVRGALPEFWTFVFLPFLFLFYYKLYKTNHSKFVVITALLSSGIILTHNLIAMATSIFLGLFLLLLLFQSKKKILFLIQSFISILLALVITSYFWIPSYFEKQYTMIDLLTSELANYNQHFVYIRQFWDSAWGYGGSIFGLNDGLSFQVGKVHILLVLLVVPFGLNLYSKYKRIIQIVFLFVIMFFVSLFMQTFYSKIVWDYVQPLWYMQFPWRFLVFSVFTSSFLAGSMFLLSISQTKKIILSFIIVVLTFSMNINYFKPEKYLLSKTDNDYTNLETLRYDTSKLAAEYTPKGIITRKTDINTTVVAIDKDHIAKSSFEVVSGNMRVKVLKDKVYTKEFDVFVLQKGIFKINTYSFPGWEVFVNNKEILYEDNNPFKLITIVLKPGNYIIKSFFSDTIYRIIGNSLSIIGFLSILVYLFLNSKFKSISLKS